ELLVLSSIVSSCYWWQRLFSSIHFETGLTSTIYCDNKQSVRIANADLQFLETKLRHVDIHQLWIRQETENGHMIVKWIPTSQQKADGLTKLLPRQLFEVFKTQLGLENPPLKDN
ncbi:hypothetical protein GcM3_186055, partial [Golovinomyces cichoracearum]